MEKIILKTSVIIILISLTNIIYGQQKSKYETLTETLKENKNNAERMIYNVRELYQDSLFKISKTESAYNAVKQSHNDLINCIIKDVENNNEFKAVRYEDKIKKLDANYLIFHDDAMAMVNATGANISFIAFLAIAIEVLRIVYDVISDRQVTQPSHKLQQQMQQQEIIKDFNMLKIK